MFFALFSFWLYVLTLTQVWISAIFVFNLNRRDGLVQGGPTFFLDRLD